MTLDEIGDEGGLKKFTDASKARGCISGGVWLTGEVSPSEPNKMAIQQQIGGHPELVTEMVKKFLFETPQGQQIFQAIMEEKLDIILKTLEARDITSSPTSENEEELDF